MESLKFKNRESYKDQLAKDTELQEYFFSSAVSYIQAE